MKIKTYNGIYIQSRDVYMIEKHHWYEPEGIFSNSKTAKKSENNLDFCCFFEEPATVQWILNQNWLVDYNVLRSFPDEAIEDIVDLTDLANDCSGKYFREQDAEYQRKFGEEFLRGQKQQEYEVEQYNNILRYRKGEIDFEFPPDYDPDGRRWTMS